MKNEMIRAAAAMIVFGAILLGLACGTANQNTNQNLNQDQNQNQNQANVALTRPAACDVLPLMGRVRDVTAALTTDFRGDIHLKKQYIPDPSNYRRPFEFRVIGIHNGARWDHLILLVEGSILERSNDKNEHKSFAAFDRVIGKYLEERCVQRVFFVPDGTLAQLPSGDLIDPEILTEAAQRGDRDTKRNIALNSEWSYCQWPERPCSDGTCNASCTRFDGNGNSSNTNTTTNSNPSNGNGNTNANVNGNANTGRTSP
jgi:hypothetical protein